ncbi:D-glucuronyl C5-epimerase family protein [Aestuariimicrobium sp. p3-SID1156]|uniref:D-glucuronyl C5-epimerase family protein n=1 Tax=Aestuariimicrobium sp. p3-SID1156 TaxID=2916038 RepID=UPI00223C4C4A|nr:D-glucuronyl C5-epimerase family protein [Aestuariimicrobium sp. p3-SID1156]MCT1458646.1 D-glucuronyl C5-epimerase family protein [Aestuariimicrobium sp. p3-SID1156]
MTVLTRRTALTRRSALGAGLASLALTGTELFGTGSAPLDLLVTSSAHGAQPTFKQLSTPALAWIPNGWPNHGPKKTIDPDYSAGFRMAPDGVPLSYIKDVWGAHPSRVGWFINYQINNLELNQVQASLDKAVQVMHGMMKRAAYRDGGAFVRYEFPWSVAHGTLAAGWHSAFAQGEFVTAAWRLHKFTGDPIFLKYRDQLLQAFFVPRAVGKPWIASVDANQCLWLEEYPFPDGHSSQVFNGQAYAIIDLLEYYYLSKDTRVLPLIKGGLYTMWRYRGNCRNPGYVSRYYNTNNNLHTSYHSVHADCFHQLYNMTRLAPFGVVLDQLIRDFCTWSKPGKVRVQAGVKVLLRQGSVEKYWTPSATTVYESSARTSFKGRVGCWSLLSSGPMAGWYAQESVATYRTGYETDRWDFRFARTVRFNPGKVTCFEVLADGRRYTRGTRTFTVTTTARSIQRACLGGRQYIKMYDGPF